MKLMVIDGNSILNRAYYGIRPLTTRDGLYTHAVFGFFTTLLRLREEEKPDALCVTFDLHAPTFRHTADEAYKATRKPMPEELRVQVPVLKEALDALRIPRYELEGWEADDLIGTISRKCEADGWECVVVTGDKDSLQLITDQTKVKLVSTRMGQTTTKDMTRSAFREQYGFDPIHMIDLKALMGDSSDNIPGVPGVGEKTAMDLIQKYGSIETIYEKMPDVEAKPAALKKLAAGEESARHSYWLATIVTDAPLDFRPEDNLVRSPGPEAYPLFLRLEFTKLIEKFGLKAENATQASAEKPSNFTVTVEQVTEPQQAETLLKLWRKADHVSLLALPDLTGVSVVCRTGETAAVTAELFFNKYQGDWNALLRTLFSGDIKKVSHNVKDLMGLLLKNDLPADGFVFDTALAAYLYVHAPAFVASEGGWLNNPGSHGLGEMLYEFTSCAANNGSGFEGLGDNTWFWNFSCGIVLILSRFIPIIGQVALAGLLAQKRYIPESAGTLKTDTVTFAVMTFAVIFIVAALSFFPAQALTTLTEHFTL